MKFKLTIWGLLFFLQGLFFQVRAQDYYCNTTIENEIQVVNGKPFLVQTVKDANRISIVSRKWTPLKGVSADGIRIVSESPNGTIIANKDFYYWIDGNPFTFEEYGAGKIIEAGKVSKVFGKDLFLINGKWKSVNYNPYSKETRYKTVPNFPLNPTVIKHFDEGSTDSYLIKDGNKVYAYHNDDGEREAALIPKLAADKTRFFETNWPYDNHFLYDDNTFYLTNILFNSTDITQDFIFLGLDAGQKFTQAKIITISDYNFFLDFGDGNIWSYADIGLRGGKTVHFYPVKNAVYDTTVELIFHNNLFYDGAWDLAYELNGFSIDFSDVADRKGLKLLTNDIYSDSTALYKLEKDGDDKRKMVKLYNNNGEIDLKKLEIEQNNAVSFWTDGKSIFRWSPDSKRLFDKLASYTSQIKDLKLAYAFNDDNDKSNIADTINDSIATYIFKPSLGKLYIEGTIIDNPMDLNTTEFLGSTVNVMGDVYDYYFKDKDAIYLYRSGKKQLEKLQLGNPQEYTEANFIGKFLGDKDYKPEQFRSGCIIEETE